MASIPIGIPPLPHSLALTAGDLVTPEAHKSLLQLYNANPIITVSTAGGPMVQFVPLAAQNQGVEITYVKSSADGNTFTLKPSGKDALNFGNPVVSGAVQGARVKIKSDGKSWYVTG